MDLPPRPPSQATGCDRMSLGHGTSSPGLESALLPHVAWSTLQSPVRNGGVRGLSGLMQQVQGSELRQVQHSTHEVHVTGVSTHGRPGNKGV